MTLMSTYQERARGPWGEAGRAAMPRRSREEGDRADEGLATFLGWFSVGLGLTEVLAPRRFSNFIGLSGDRDCQSTVRLVGLRELASGVGLLTRRKPAGWLWSRVAGDAMDLALLGGALASGAPCPARVSGATLAVIGVTALDVYCAVATTQHSGSGGQSWLGGPTEVRKSITVNRPAEELYRTWRDFDNLPRFMSHLESVRDTGGGRSHWRAKAPAGTTVAWDAETTEDVPGRAIAWRSVGGDVDTAGSVRFVPAPGGRGTEVHVWFRYDPPGGPVGALVAKLFGEAPDQQVMDDLRHFKQVMETGQVVVSEGGADGTLLAQRPAQPRPQHQPQHAGGMR
jgi:uncharacterized membrane protein